MMVGDVFRTVQTDFASNVNAFGRPVICVLGGDAIFAQAFVHQIGIESAGSWNESAVLDADVRACMKRRVNIVPARPSRMIFLVADSP